ncbi:GAF domain-containing protein [Streptomyces sp. NPDC052043]|uniref:GAF domain-containing protein n=1 Tax=Streptomyces sp. NPDC052043 TaxID=3365684 RepID=UPI0037D1EEDA
MRTIGRPGHEDLESGLAIEGCRQTRQGRTLTRPCHDPARAQKVRENGMHSRLTVPIRARGRVLGVAVFIRTENLSPFQEDGLLLAEELVTRAALCLDIARRYACERTAALALQRSLLPRRLAGVSRPRWPRVTCPPTPTPASGATGST